MTSNTNTPAETKASETETVATVPPALLPKKETGGPKGLEPTRYGDWERKGKCVDF